MAGVLFFNEKTIVVPDDFDTIQEAGDDADPGDIILVKAKENSDPYEEEVTINKDNIKLIGIGKSKPLMHGMNFHDFVEMFIVEIFEKSRMFDKLVYIRRGSYGYKIRSYAERAFERA